MSANVRGKDAVKTWGLRALLIAVVLGAWLYATGPGQISALLLPTVSAVGKSLGGLFQQGAGIWGAIGITVTEIVVAAAMSLVGGILVGLLAARRQLPARTVEPLLAWAYMVPLVIFYPLFVLTFGFGMWSKILYAAVSGFLPIAYNTLRAIRSVDPRYIRAGIAFGASSGQLGRIVKLGAARPMLLAGIRIGLAVNVITVILAEMLSSDRGLGFELSQATQLLDGARSYALILIIIVIVGILQTLIERFTRQEGQ